MNAIKYTLLFFLCLSCVFLLCPLGSIAATPSAESTLLTALTVCQAEVDMAAYGLTVGELGQLLADVLHEHPELFHMAPHLSYRYNGDGLVLTVYPTYTLSGAALTAARHLYEATLAALCALIDPAWSEADRALAVHDLLAVRYAYDTKENNYDAYSLFRDGVGVCQAYAMAYLAVGRAVGLAVDLVYSDAMDHAWNHVRVDGEWYHVDVTRDDPMEGDSPVVRHTRLLRSDEGMAALGYTNYTCVGNHMCHSTRFETAAGAGIFDGWSTVPRRVEGAWCFVGEDHRITPVTLPSAADGAVTVHAAGDVTCDGQVTPEDLLALRRLECSVTGITPFTVPCDEAALDSLREQILDGISCLTDHPFNPTRSKGSGSVATASST